MRWFRGLLGCLWLAYAGLASAEVQLELALKDAKTAFRSGEPVVLELTFRSSDPGVAVNTTTTNPASPVDEVVLAPPDGVTPWLEQQARGHRYSPDYMALTKLEPGTPVRIYLTLNELYRFDQPGYFTVHLVSRRVGRVGRYGTLEGASALTSNDVSFNVTSFPESDEAALAESLESQIRSSVTEQAADTLARQLAFLGGDAATRVKLALYLHPKEFYPFAVDESMGLWIARNRGMVVAGLEKALADPAQLVSPSLLDLLVALRLSFEQPYQPGTAPPGPEVANELRRGYVHQLAVSLPARAGEARLEAAQAIFLGAQGQAAPSDLAAAREVIITHFGEVNEYNVDWLLNSRGSHLRDPRMIPALESLLDNTRDPTFSSNRDAALKLLAELAPSEVPRYLVREACVDHPVVLHDVTDLTSADTLPEVDECLRAKLQRQLASGGRRFDLGVTMGYIARFADGSLVEQVRAAYLMRTSDWDQSAQASAVVYLMRWDPKRSGALLEPMLPGRDQYGGAMILFLTTPAHLPADGLRAAFRQQLSSRTPALAKSYPYALAQIGAPEDREFLRQELQRVRQREQTMKMEGDGDLEGELVAAVVHGTSWQASKEETDALVRDCVSEVCRKRFAPR